MTELLRWSAAILVGALTVGTARAQEGEGSNRIRHVRVITLENEGFDTTFGVASKAPYLSKH